jgi:hypothetical protein
MNNVIHINSEEQRQIDALKSEIENKEAIIKDKERDVSDLKDKQFTLEGQASKATGADKKSLNAEIAEIKSSIKKRNNSIASEKDLLEDVKKELAKIQSSKNYQVATKTSQDTATRVFEENNIHYIAFDQQWWSVDPVGGRMDVRINSSDSAVIKDLIFLDSDWTITNDQELKKLAKEMGRMYKHMVRDFAGQRSGVYNQMDTIRNQWLEAIYDVKPHDSFRILCLSIAGGDEDYADQIEKFIAYRYCHPEDVMIPNIDSCAIGGTGRDTLYNIMRVIFTDECCGSVGVETFKGIHNGDLFGKMIVKVDEKDSHSVPIDKVKEFTGGTRYRHRSMNQDARDVARLFTFIFFRNGFTSTAKLAGTGSSGEDRRFEPMIARVNLPRHLALYHGLITDLNQIPDDDTTKAMTMLIKDWQRDYYKDETRISEWLGHIITKHDVRNMTELLPLHGKYYKEMLQRQKKGIDGFMPKFMNLMNLGSSTVINITHAHKLYEIAESQKCTKDWFKNAMMYWLNVQLGWDCQEVMENVYTWDGCTPEERRKMLIVQNRLSVPEKLVFSLDDYIDKDALDDKGTTVGEKINIFSLKDELR